MISAEKCRAYAVRCELLASSDGISTIRSQEQLIMAMNWNALADEIDRENAAAIRQHKRSRLSRALGASLPIFLRDGVALDSEAVDERS